MKFNYKTLDVIKDEEDLKRLFNAWSLIAPHGGVKEMKLIYYFYLLTKKYKLFPLRIRRSVRSYRSWGGHTRYLEFETTKKDYFFKLTISSRQTSINFINKEYSWSFLDADNDYFGRKFNLLTKGDTKDFIKAMKKISVLFLLCEGEKRKRFKLKSFNYAHGEGRKMFNRLFRRFANGKLTKKKFINSLTLVV